MTVISVSPNSNHSSRSMAHSTTVSIALFGKKPWSSSPSPIAYFTHLIHKFFLELGADVETCIREFDSKVIVNDISNG
jgi:hypothetical protein